MFSIQTPTVLLLLVVALLSATLGVSAVCSERDLRGWWAFLESGWGPNQTRWDAIGVVQLDGRGNVTQGWSTNKVGNETTDYWNLTGNYSIEDPCNVALWLTSPDISWQIWGVLVNNKHQLDNFVNRANVAVTGQFSWIDEKCSANSLRGLWSGAGVNTINGTMNAYTATIDCPTKSNCTVITNAQPEADEQYNSSVPVTYNTSWPCKFELGGDYEGVVAVPFYAGVYVMQTAEGNDATATLSAGVK